MSYYLGIDLGGTNIVAGLYDQSYQLVAKKSIPTGARRPFDVVVADIAALAKQVAGEHHNPPLSYVGVGVPGTIHPESGRIIFANNLGWVDVDFVAEFRRHWDIPVFMANDANCALLGEAKAGSGRGHPNFMMLTLGTGVGGGVLLNNQLYLGGNGLGCELGHTLFSYEGLPCNCGKAGCLEMYLSVTALRRQTQEAMEANPHSVMHQLVAEKGKISGKTAFLAKNLGDEAGTRVVEQYIEYLSAGIVSLFSAFRPPVIVIGGGICNEGEGLMAPVRQQVGQVIKTTDFMEPPLIVKAELGSDAGVIGAALLGCEKS